MWIFIELAGFVVAIVAIVAVSRVLQAYFRSKGEARRRDEEREDGHDERLARLEERIKVLERIVTDEQFELKQRFRGL